METMPSWASRRASVEAAAKPWGTAATVTDRIAWRLGSGLILPGGGGVTVGYQESEAVTLDTRSGRTTKLMTSKDAMAAMAAAKKATGSYKPATG